MLGRPLTVNNLLDYLKDLLIKLYFTKDKGRYYSNNSEPLINVNSPDYFLVW